MIETAKIFITIYCLKDGHHRGHAQQVQAIALEIAKMIGLNGKDGELIKYASLLHDIGKALIPDEILKKKDPLDKSEWELVRKHTLFGYELLKFFLPEIAEAIRAHHENWDGTGYPDQKKEDNIPLPSRIIRIADSISAGISKRAYKRPKPLERIVIELEKGAGKEYDPGIVNALLSERDRISPHREIALSF